ncbi:AraC family transcriptional regulator [Paenibacillus sepulcri]|uniref:AraC family transcriptional regulator n=1 Tax=Paenibacillus sepulcri TaxID=359917 RepID=A0ABS7BY18_9BACL|nr:AraC family transcriptional regulator [Paenibacillus sepulcri]
MKKLEQITPSIRIAHHYRFSENRFSEMNRVGYCYALHLFDSGRGKVQIDGTMHNAAKGTLIFLRPDQPHSFFPDPVNPFSSFNIYYEPWRRPALNTSMHLVRDKSEYDKAMLTPVMDCPELEHMPNVLQLENQPAVFEMMALIVESHQNTGEPYAEAMENSLLYALLLQLFMWRAHQAAYDSRIQRIKERLDMDSSLNYLDLMEQEGLKKSQFHRLFLEVTGLPPRAYCLRNQMKQAVTELLESRKSISEIADSLGFPSIHYFSKRFKSYYGVSPKAYREGKQIRWDGPSESQ